MQELVENPLAERYLELLKKTLMFSLWPEPPVPALVGNWDRPWMKRMIVSAVETILGKFGFQLCRPARFSETARVEGRIWPGYAYTMIGLRRLDNILSCAESVLHDRIPGDFIETGAWRGGACIFMRGILAAYNIKDRRVFVADSFQGLPVPDTARYPNDAGDMHHCLRVFDVSEDAVKDSFRRFGLLDDQVVLLKGWFRDTLSVAPIQRLAILRLDGDMYGSTMEALRTLYAKLEPGGFCIIDDYALAGCRQAVIDFRDETRVTEPLQEIDWTGRFWRKHA